MAIAAVPYRVEPAPRATAATDPAAPDAYQAANPGQGYRAHFTPERIVITAAAEAATTSASPAWEVVLTLAAYGRGQDLRPVTLGVVTTEGNRVEIARRLAGQAGEAEPHAQAPALVEWYVNRAEGLEQGFTLRERPCVSSAEQSDIDPCGCGWRSAATSVPASPPPRTP